MMKFGDSYDAGADYDSMQPDVPHPSERRIEPRQILNLDGVCEISDPPQRFPCKIIDLSSSGAQLEFASTDPIPPIFKVYVDALNVVMECRTVWSTPKQLGVEQTTKSMG